MLAEWTSSLTTEIPANLPYPYADPFSGNQLVPIPDFEQDEPNVLYESPLQP